METTELDPLAETNNLLRAIVLLLVLGQPPEKDRVAFLSSVGIRLGGPETSPETSPEAAPDPERGLVQFPERSPSGRR